MKKVVKVREITTDLLDVSENELSLIHEGLQVLRMERFEMEESDKKLENLIEKLTH